MEVENVSIENPPVDVVKSSFEGWTPGAAPAPAPEVPGVDGNAHETPAADAPSSDEWYKGFGEFENADAFKAHYTNLATERGNLEAKLKEVEGKSASYSSDAIAQMDAYARKLASEGITDPKEIQKQVLAKMQEASTDYLEIAKTNPADIIGRSVRERYKALGASDDDIARAIRKETILPAKPKLEDYGDESDPEYIEKMEAYRDAESDMRLKAMAIAQDIEGKREKIDFQPKGVLTKEQQEARINEAWKRYDSRIPELEAKVKELGFPIDGDYQASIKEAIKNPHDFINQFFTEDGEPDPVAIGFMKAQIASIPLQIAKAVKEAVDKQTREEDIRLHNPKTTLTPNPGGNQSAQLSDAEIFEKWGRERGYAK